MERVKRLLIIIGLTYLFFGLFIFMFQRKYIYYPTPQDFNNCPDLAGASKIVYEGTRMYVHKVTDDWIIIYHGNAGSACDRAYYLNYFNPKNYSYIIVEYTGYSNDSASPSQAALMKNVEAVNKYLKTQKPRATIVTGESLGAALATYHSFINRPDKLILISSFDSLANVGQWHYWYYPAKLLLWDKYPSEIWAKNADNVLIIHGTDDDIIPIRFGKALFDKISGKNKTFVEIPKAGHNDIFDHPLTIASIANFLK